MVIHESKHPEVPNGPYCYHYRSKTCPHWYAIEYNQENAVVRAGCKLTKKEDKYPQDLNLLWDKVKLCGINDNF